MRDHLSESITCSRCRRLFNDRMPEWPDIRSRSLGRGKGLRWLCPQCYAADPPDHLEVYHIRMGCGHGVYWENGLIATAIKGQTCPWCYGRGGKQAVPHRAYVDYGPPYGRVYPDMRRLGPGDGGGSLPVVVHHYPDDSCCQGVEVSWEPPKVRA